MILEFLQSLSEMQIVGELTVLSLLIGGIIMAGGVIIAKIAKLLFHKYYACLLYTSPSPRDATLSRMPSSA